MATYKTKAIILSSYPYREYDRIVTFFSADYGRLEARSRGVRKLQSKLAGHLEPLIETELLLAHGRRWDILAGSRTLNSQSKIRGNIHLLAAALVCAEAVKMVTKPMAADRDIFELLRRTFSVLSSAGLPLINTRILVIKFLWDLIAAAGFAPELGRCIHCLSPFSHGTFSFEGGGLLCPQCSRRDVFAVAVDKEALSLLSLRPQTDFSNWLKFGARDKERIIRDVVLNFWHRIVAERQLRSLAFWEILYQETISNY